MRIENKSQEPQQLLDLSSLHVETQEDGDVRLTGKVNGVDKRVLVKRIPENFKLASSGSSVIYTGWSVGICDFSLALLAMTGDKEATEP